MRKRAKLSREVRMQKAKYADNHKNRRRWHKKYLSEGFVVGIETLEKSGRIRRIYWRELTLPRKSDWVLTH